MLIVCEACNRPSWTIILLLDNWVSSHFKQYCDYAMATFFVEYTDVPEEIYYPAVATVVVVVVW
jgi:hypothetical protein